MILKDFNIIKLSSNPRLHLALIFLFSSIVLFNNLGRESVRALDEAKWAQISREMIKSGDWLTPRIGGRPFRHKPPLRMWLNTVAFYIFGESEFALRFWSAVSGIGILLLTYLFSYALFGNNFISISSSLVLLLSPLFIFEYLRMGDEHATFTLLFLLCLYFFWLGRGEKKYFYYSSIFFGLAFLTYGFGALFAPLIIFTYLVITGEIKRYKPGTLMSYLLISLLIIAPWYIFQYIVNGTNFLKIYLAELTYYFDASFITRINGFTNFLGRELVNNMSSCIDASFFRGVDFYINVLRFAFFPWWVPLTCYLSFVILKSLSGLYKKESSAIKSERTFIIIWLISVLSVLFIFGDKMSWRIYFLFPIFAILTAKSLQWFYLDKGSKVAMVAVIFFLMASYEFKLFIPACIGPSCVKYIELYGFPKMVNSLFISQFSMQYLLIFLLSAFILLFVYILARDKKQYFIHRIIFFVLVVFLLSISLKNSAAFFFQYKNKSDIDLVIREIKKIDYLDNIVVYDSILYNMKNGLIVPEYSLGGAATADKGEHRWDAYYLIDRLNVGKKFISNIEDLKSLLQSNNKAKTLILINKNSLKTEDKKESKFLPKAMLEKGDYLMILLN